MTGSGAEQAAALEVRELSKRFPRITVLDALSFSVPKGATCAFIGSNGSGKTTTFSLIGGFLKPTHGEMWIDGEKRAPLASTRGEVGLLPQDQQFFEERTLRSQLTLFAQLIGFTGPALRHEVARVLESVSLQEKRDTPAKNLSRGMRVRFGIAQALIGSPALLLLDEPLTGLDPVVRAELKALLGELKCSTTMLISSHELGELQSLCDHIIAIEKGRCLFQGPMKEILESGEQKVHYTIAQAEVELSTLQNQLTPLKLTATKISDRTRLTVSFTTGTPADVNAKVIPHLLAQNLPIHEITHSQTLEQTYLTTLTGVRHPVG
ncbi:ABC transporter ATP-binding protein [bacterium]|nr:ABC transporter ATP-binding protein [bacterium]